MINPLSASEKVMGDIRELVYAEVEKAVDTMRLNEKFPTAFSNDLFTRALMLQMARTGAVIAMRTLLANDYIDMDKLRDQMLTLILESVEGNDENGSNHS